METMKISGLRIWLKLLLYYFTTSFCMTTCLVPCHERPVTPCVISIWWVSISDLIIVHLTAVIHGFQSASVCHITLRSIYIHRPSLAIITNTSILFQPTTVITTPDLIDTLNITANGRLLATTSLGSRPLLDFPRKPAMFPYIDVSWLDVCFSQTKAH
jgi:hypothetical protein